MSYETHEHHAATTALLQSGTARSHWQSLEELAQQADFTSLLSRERPREAAILERSGMDRRTFLKLMGAAFALSGLTGCTAKPPDQPIIPYVRKPEEIVLGIPLFFASTMTLGGYATGVVIETHEGRPTRVEGNPQHPASLGGSDPLLLASILELYNPDRSTSLRNQGASRTWDDFLKALPPVLETATAGGLRILTETITSPTLTSQLQALLKKYPGTKWHQYEPVGQDTVLAGARLAFGDAVNTVYHFDKADVVLALDGDFMTSFPGSLRYAREFIDRRRVRGDGLPATMNRLYVVESTPTLTGAMADHRLPLQPSKIEQFARAVAQALSEPTTPASADWDATWFNSLVADLKAHPGTSLVVPGNEQSAAVHAIAHAINAALGNVGTTVTYTASVVSNPVSQIDDLGQLVKDMLAGQVKALVILGGNPVYNAPADIAFANALQKTPFTAHLSMYDDETSALCQWHLPETHYIEAWSDARAFDGTVSLSQPPIGPLFADTRSAHEVLALLLQDKRGAYDILRAYWQGTQSADQFDLTWQSTLEAGVWANSALPPITPTLRTDLAQKLAATPVAATGIELIFRPDPTIWDGRFAANSWLQELPKPLTKLTWDNAALFSPALAARLKLANEDVVELHYQGRMVQAPVWILPGHPDNAVTVPLGYGRTQGGEVGLNAGFNAYALRTAAAPWFGSGLEIRPTKQTYKLATTQQHFRMDGRDPVQVATLETFLKQPNFAHAEEHSPVITLLPKDSYEGNAWGMSIDLTACIGCNACVIACQSENNIPTVGKEEVMRSREMHWIRVDRYYAEDEANPNTYFQPVPCMQCEKAPCELVCPVQATTHSSEGLNQMVYNRCVGTRYCSGNCPYNVRHFNFSDWTDYTPILEEMRNPNVTVRARGVMEKCTYCVQRIDQARITADKENRPIRDGEAMPACASACPTRAIVFGNINDRQSQVTELKAQPHDYSLLAELNTKPRTTYLARITNPNETVGS